MQDCFADQAGESADQINRVVNQIIRSSLVLLLRDSLDQLVSCAAIKRHTRHADTTSCVCTPLEFRHRI